MRDLVTGCFGAVLVLASVSVVGEAASCREANYSRLVYPGEDGRLVYTPNERGDVIPDFSHAGYRGGGVALPDVPGRMVLVPVPGDNTRRIQRALDRVGSMPADYEGRRGAVVLSAGRYEVSGSLYIRHSGVVLRGEGDGEDGTVLVATGTGRRTLLYLGGEGEWEEIGGTRRRIADDYVPVGTRTFAVEDSSPFSVGDTIIVYRPSTAEWISVIGMDRIPRPEGHDRLVQWTAGSRDLPFDRMITEIAGDRLTVDAPLTHAFDREYGGGYVFRYAFPGRLREVGVESLRAESNYNLDDPFDEDHAWTLAEFDAVENAWMRDVTARHFGNGAAYVESFAKWVTIQDCRSIDPVSRIAGSRRNGFRLHSQLTLVQRCYSRDGRHDFVTGPMAIGPNAFVDSLGENAHAAAGPHARYAVGVLYDNITITDSGGEHASTGGIEIRNRGPLGSGHGWCAANNVAWNCVARWIMVESPPLAQNWAIGCIETGPGSPRPPFASEMRPPLDAPLRGDGIWESYGRHVEPESLYTMQLEERLRPRKGQAGSGGARF